MNLEGKLMELGLTDKEAAVYLAMLNLGPSTAQDIAIGANVNRATTYVMIETLVAKGVASQMNKDKKTLFIAEDPYQIVKVLERQKIDIEDKMGEARKVVPMLQELYNLNRGKATVRLIEGRESIRIIQNDVARAKNRAFDNIINLPLAVEKFPVGEFDHRRVYYKEDFKVRTIFTYDPSKSVPNMPFAKNEQRRMIPQDLFPILGEVILYDNKVSIIHFVDKIFCIIIEDDNLHKTFKSIFDLCWVATEKYQIKDK